MQVSHNLLVTRRLVTTYKQISDRSSMKKAFSNNFAFQLNLFQFAVEPWLDGGPRGSVKQNSACTLGENTCNTEIQQKSHSKFYYQVSIPSVCMTEGCVGKQPNSHFILSYLG